MRQYHPITLRILSERRDIPKRYSCSVWSEVFKWKASCKSHPKCFINDDYDLGVYLKIVYELATAKGCNLDKSKLKSLSRDVQSGFNTGPYSGISDHILINRIFSTDYFDSNYLFSDACSLYYKGINIFKDIFGDEWRKYVPVESLKEIKRQVDNTLIKNL